MAAQKYASKDRVSSARLINFELWLSSVERMIPSDCEDSLNWSHARPTSAGRLQRVVLPDGLLTIHDRLLYGLDRFKLCAHSLDLCRLLFNDCSESYHFFLVLFNRSLEIAL